MAQYGDLLPGWFEVYIGLEGAASVIRTYENQFIPGLLQTPAVRQGGDQARRTRRLPTRELDRRVALRIRRQDRLLGDRALKLWAVIDEAVVRRALGGREVMREQIEHLLEMTARSNVTVAGRSVRTRRARGRRRAVQHPALPRA